MTDTGNVGPVAHTPPARRVLLLGATGRIGAAFAEKSATAGHRVRALVRHPAPIDPRVQQLVGDPLKVSDVARALDDVSDVVVALGLRRRSDALWAPLISPPDVVERAMHSLLEAVGTRAVRITTISAHGAGESWATLPLLVRGVIRMSQVRHSYADHARQEALITTSGLASLIVRPTMLTDTSSTAYREVVHPTELPLSANISRGAVAQYVLDALRDRRSGIVTLTGQR